MVHPANLVLLAGVNDGTVELDGQGIRGFEMRDPEGNEIEVVEEG
jgi:hypothetical protein